MWKRNAVTVFAIFSKHIFFLSGLWFCASRHNPCISIELRHNVNLLYFRLATIYLASGWRYKWGQTMLSTMLAWWALIQDKGVIHSVLKSHCGERTIIRLSCIHIELGQWQLLNLISWILRISYPTGAPHGCPWGYWDRQHNRQDLGPAVYSPYCPRWPHNVPNRLAHQRCDRYDRIWCSQRDSAFSFGVTTGITAFWQHHLCGGGTVCNIYNVPVLL